MKSFDAMLRNSDFILQTLEGNRMEWEESMWFWNSASMAGRKEGLDTRGKAQKGEKLSRFLIKIIKVLMVYYKVKIFLKENCTYFTFFRVSHEIL